MKTFKQFKEDNQHLPEGVGAIVGGALKLGGKALSAYSAYKAGESLVQGKPKQAAFNALGAVPGGKIFKGIRALGGAKNLAKAGSFVQSANRFNVTGMTPNAYAKGVDKTFDVATKGVTNTGKKLFGKKNKKVEPEKTYTAYNPTVRYDTGKKRT